MGEISNLTSTVDELKKQIVENEAQIKNHTDISSEIESKQQELVEISSEIEKLKSEKTDIIEIKREIVKLKTEKESLEEEILQLKNIASVLQQEVNDFQNGQETIISQMKSKIDKISSDLLIVDEKRKDTIKQLQSNIEMLTK